MAQQYKIHIGGSGNQDEIADALESLVISIRYDLQSSLNFGKLEWEDHILFTRIEEIDEEEL